jgi:hypothetical protein
MNHSRRAHLWRIHWPEIEPTMIRYQEAVTLDRVLSEHRAAVAAEPMESEASGNARPAQGTPRPLPSRVVATAMFL